MSDRNPLIGEDYLEHYFRVIDGKVDITNVKQKRRGRRKGYKHSSETKAKISDQMRNRSKSPETRSRISNKLKGREKSDETKEKISKEKKGTLPAHDLLKDYTKPEKYEDRVWLSQNMTEEQKAEVESWIKDHAEEFNHLTEDNSVRTYKDLRADAMKEQVDLLEHYRNDHD
jgi:flagellar motor protein MotB